MALGFYFATSAASVRFFEKPVRYCILCSEHKRRSLLIYRPLKATPPPHTLYDEDLAFQLVVGCIWKAEWIGGKMISKQTLTTEAGKVGAFSGP